jgi:hypothetical protein
MVESLQQSRGIIETDSVISIVFGPQLAISNRMDSGASRYQANPRFR